MVPLSKKVGSFDMLKAALLKMVSVFPAAILARGHDYVANGQVLNLRFSDGLLKGRVKGRANAIHDVYIDLKVWPKTPARCNCSSADKCEHVVACLLALQAREQISGVLPLNFDKHHEPINEQLFKRHDLIREEIVNADDMVWYSDLKEQGHDFFGYQLGILVDGKPMSIVPLVADLIRTWRLETLESLPNTKRIQLPFTKGRVLELELGRIKPLLRLLLEYHVESKACDELRIKRYQLLLMQEAEKAIAATTSRWRATEALYQQLQQLTFAQALPAVQLPTGLTITLRDYQYQGVCWLQLLRSNQFSGVLADDMGLGKTAQTLAHLQLEKEHGRLKKACLIIVPTSLIGNWYEEAKRFTPNLRVLIFHGSTRHQDAFDMYDIVLSTYGLIQREKRKLLSYDFYYIILDEAQFIKNARTKTTQVIQQLKALHRLCLTGTPLENHLGELWSLFHFLMPGLLGDARQFKQFFRIPIEKQADTERRDILSHRVNPFMLRRTKNQVATQLPPKTEITQIIELTGAQRDLYEAIRMMMEQKVRDAIAQQGLGKSQIVLLDALLKLRQICCDPKLLSIPQASIAHGYSAKMDALMNLLDNLIAEGRFVLVFSQFTSMLTLIEAQLIARQYGYLKLTGQTNNRQDLVKRFQAGEAPVFLISLKAGGTGLNLTRADTVILYDPWWNPAVQDQATDRSHRIGQEKPVFVYKLITKSTVEEVIMGIQDKKRALFEGVLSNQTSGGIGLTHEDIAQFFMPLT